MEKIKTHFGHPCYHLDNGTVKLFTTVLAGNTNPYYKVRGKEVSPFFIPPWWNEGWLADAPPLFNTCRGNFFCLPLGGDLTGSCGTVIPIHGNCANESWLLADISHSGEKSVLRMDFEEELGTIHKEIRVIDGHNAVYEVNVTDGWAGEYPVGYHPTLKLPDRPGTAHFAMSRFVDGYTTFENHESADNGGYSLFKNAQKITDLAKIQTIFDRTVDFRSQPIEQGYDDVFMTINAQDGDFAYVAVTYRDEGYVYYQLKNPNNLKSTMFWVSNGGRHYAPWNGRCKPVLGLEETVSFYHYGMPRSNDKNPINSLGYDTAIRMEKGVKYAFALIYGVAEVPAGFKGVERIDRSANGIRIVGLGGEKVDVELDTDFVTKIYSS